MSIFKKKYADYWVIAPKKGDVMKTASEARLNIDLLRRTQTKKGGTKVRQHIRRWEGKPI